MDGWMDVHFGPWALLYEVFNPNVSKYINKQVVCTEIKIFGNLPFPYWIGKVQYINNQVVWTEIKMQYLKVWEDVACCLCHPIPNGLVYVCARQWWADTAANGFTIDRASGHRWQQLREAILKKKSNFMKNFHKMVTPPPVLYLWNPYSDLFAHF